MEVLALAVLVIFSVVGFAAIFFTTFGTLIIFIGVLIYALLTGFSIISVKALLLIFILYLVGEVFEYIAIIVGAKRLGASNIAIAGAISGGIAGAILGAVTSGVGVIIGVFLGIFLGAFLVELIVQRDLVASLKSGLGGVLGRVGSIVIKTVIALLMVVIIIASVVNNYG